MCVIRQSEPTKYVLTARFSPRPDSAESESNDSQLRDLREFVASVGGIVKAEFQDCAKSGDDEDREGLWAAVECLEPGDVLLAWKADRIARSVFLSEFIRREVDRKGARLVFLHGGTDDTPEGVLLRQVLAAFDEFVKKMNARRTSAAMLSLQKSGRLMGGRVPFGFTTKRIEGKTKRGRPRRQLVPDPVQQQAIARVKELASEGSRSWAIRRQLKAEGHRIGRGTVEKIIAGCHVTVSSAEPASEAVGAQPG